MRKKSTFEELANSTLVKPVLKPGSIPYISPYDSTAAVAEYRRMLTKTQVLEHINAEYRAETAAAARGFGVPQEVFESFAAGLVSQGSKMHEDLTKQQQHYAAAAQKQLDLQTDAFLKQHGTMRQGLARNTDMQKK